VGRHSSTRERFTTIGLIALEEDAELHFFDDFDEATRERAFIGRRALLMNTRAAGRTKDLADVEALEAAEEEISARR
jgi:hypothetical protein